MSREYINACEASIRAVLGDAITIEEFENDMVAISDAVQMAKYRNENPATAASRISNDMIRSAERSAMKAKLNRFLAVTIENTALRKVDEAHTTFNGKKDSLFNGLRASVTGINTNIFGGQRSASGISKGIMGEFHGKLMTRLEHEGLVATFRHGMVGDFEIQVAMSIQHMNTKDAIGTPKRRAGITGKAYDDANKIAKIITDIQEELRVRLNRAGTDIPRASGFIGHLSHDPAKLIRAGFEKWKEVMGGELDWDAMGIPGIRSDLHGPRKAGETLGSRREEFLRSAYNAMRSGVRKELGVQAEPLAYGFKGPANLARSLSHSRLFIFKDAEGWVRYNKEFGSGRFRDSITQDITMSAKNIGVLETMTTNPEAFVKNTIAAVERKYRDTDIEAVEYLKAREKILLRDLDVVTGAINIGAHTTTAKVGEWWRALKTMAMLGSSVITGFSDIVFLSTNRMYQGRSLTQAWGDAIMAPFTRLEGKERRLVADLLGVGLEGRIGSMMSRFSAEDLSQGQTSGMLNFFFKLNLLGPWTDSMKASATIMIARDLAITSGKSFDRLAPAHKNLLGIYGIDAKMWDIIRAAKRKADDGREYILPGDIEGVSDDLFKGMSEFAKRKAKAEARNNLFALYSSEADFAVPTPGAREQSMMTQGLTPDTPAGQAIRAMMQFKAFPLTATTKVAGRAWYGGGSNMLMANLIGGSIIMGVAIVQMKELAKGREPRDWLDPKLLIDGILQGGAAGLYGDFLLARHSEYGGSVGATLLGPIASDVEKIIRAGQSIGFEGDVKTAGKEMTQLLKGITPGSNLFYTRMAFDYAIYYQLQELLNPGYVERMERNLKNRTGQEYLNLPIFGTPAETIRYGGGFNR
jgi:hypothetical protein